MVDASSTNVNYPARVLYLVLGVACVGLGYVGVVVPGMPSTVFFICALWAFKRSSPRFENWLLNHRVFGPTLRDWEEYRSIRPRTKIFAIATMSVCVGISLCFIKRPVAQIIIAATCLLVAIYITTRKSKLD
jgi:uncharacterized membrane protein YbaN (DUF454 family)